MLYQAGRCSTCSYIGAPTIATDVTCGMCVYIAHIHMQYFACAVAAERKFSACVLHPYHTPWGMKDLCKVESTCIDW
jgi:hypothetical protein